MPPSHPSDPSDPSDRSGHSRPEHPAPRRDGGIREDGLRRLTTLTVTASLAAVAATGMVSVAAYHASTSRAPSSVDAGGTDTLGTTDQLRGPAEAPRPGSQPPAGVSSGS
ncbi:MAG TPA: hypothetical protein VIR27_12760 [Mycobacteriales bacterium]|jgi:hypothetical protein